jgi:hypothetical protein
MRILPSFVSVVLALFAGSVPGQVEFRLAYMREQPNALPAAFPNDHLFKYMSAAPFIGPADLKKAAASLQQGRGMVSIEITESARKKFNGLVAANVRAQERDVFEDHVGLAVLVDGRVRSVIQGVFHELPSREFWWSPADDRLPARAQLQEAQALAKRINENRP